LVVDDEALIAAQLEERLEAMGYEPVGTAGNAEDCLRLCRELSPDLVLLDIVMPGTMDGIEAASIILRDFAIPVIFVTAFSDERTLTRAGQASPFGFVVKPFRAEQVRAAVECALARRDHECAHGLAGDVDRLLLREAHHRFANNLGALVNLLEFEGSGDNTPRTVLADCQRRIRSIARIHEQFSRSRDAAAIDFSGYVRQLVEDLGKTFAMPGREIRIASEIESLSIGYDLARYAGLLINELVINALKYAFPTGGEGAIHISFHADAAMGILSVRDNGCGIDPAATPDGESIGLQLVSLMVRQLKGVLERVSDGQGTAVTVRFPLPGKV
jgi:two-component sensor histidine kinase